MASQDYVGIDLHRRRSVIVRTSSEGEVLDEVRIENDPVALGQIIEEWGSPETAIEATYGWYWAVDALEAAGSRVHLIHPLGLKALAYQRVKRDGTDARLLADVVRAELAPESWIPPREYRELREIVRFRAKLVALRSGMKAQVHAVLAKEGLHIPVTDIFGVEGQKLLDAAPLDDVYRYRVETLRALIGEFDIEIRHASRLTTRRLRGHRGYAEIQRIPGVGPTIAAVFVAEIGDIGRFQRADQLASWAGLTPRHRESDTTVRRGRITKQGSKLVRWAAVEAATCKRNAPWLTPEGITKRRGAKIARVATARRILKLVFYGLRDGHIRCLDPQAA